MRSVFLKTLAVSAVLALIFACTKSENPSGGNTVYSIAVSKFTARVGHEDVIKTLTADLEKTAASFVTVDDTAAIEAIDSIVNIYNHGYVSGEFSLQKGVENGTRLNLKTYKLQKAGYSIVSVTGATYSTLKRLYKNVVGGPDISKFRDDSIEFAVQLDSLDIRVSVSDDESAMKTWCQTLATEWSKKKTVLSNFALCKDNDTLGLYAVRVGSDVVKTTAIGYSAMVGDSAQIASLKKEMTEALAKYDKEGYSNLEVAAKAIEIAKKYNNYKVDGYLYLYRQYNVDVDNGYVPYYDFDNEDWVPSDNFDYFVNITVTSGAITPHKWQISMDYNLSIDTTFLKWDGNVYDNYRSFLTDYEILRNVLLTLRDRAESAEEIQNAFEEYILDYVTAGESSALNGTYYTGDFSYSYSGEDKTGTYVKVNVTIPILPRMVIKTDLFDNFRIDSLGEDGKKYTTEKTKEATKYFKNQVRQICSKRYTDEADTSVTKAELRTELSKATYLTKVKYGFKTTFNGKLWARIINDSTTTNEGSDPRNYYLAPKTFEGKDTLAAKVYEWPEID